MNKELANKLRIILEPLPFVDLFAGLAQVQEYNVNPEIDPEKKGIPKMLTKKFPVSYDTNLIDCGGKEVPLIPDSNRKGILYFEDAGTANIKASARGIDYKSQLVLVCWMNKEKITPSPYDEITLKCITQILSKLITNPINVGYFTRLKIQANQIYQQDKRIFASYTYNEAQNQYLRPPFEFFAIRLTCDYSIPSSCVENVIVNPYDCNPLPSCENGIVTEEGNCISLETNNNDFINLE